MNGWSLWDHSWWLGNRADTSFLILISADQEDEVGYHHYNNSKCLYQIFSDKDLHCLREYKYQHCEGVSPLASQGEHHSVNKMDSCIEFRKI